MSVRLLSVMAVTVLALGTAAADEPDDKVFGLTRVHQFHLTVAANDYAAMDPRPPQGPSAPAGRPPSGPGRPAPGSPDFGAGNLGYEFEYVRAVLEAGDLRLQDVGLRYKGSGTYLVSQRQAKRSFKIDFNRYIDGQEFHGLTKLNLNSGVMDPTKAREALAYAVFRSAGVPAPRTAFAEVTLTVPGKYDREYLGLYTVVEQVDERFLKTHFKDGKGLLLKPEGIRGLPHFGDDPAVYEHSYNPKSKPGRGDWKRLVEFTRLVNQAPETEFRKLIGSYLDVDSFVRFLAANVLLASLDGFLGMGHNYYLYQSPATGKFTFIPWDLDLAFGAFGLYGSTVQLIGLSIDHPHLGENRLIDRLLAMPEVKATYREQVRRLAREVFTAEALGRDLAAVEKLAREPLARESKAAAGRREGVGFGLPGMTGGMFGGGIPLRTFIERRAASVAAQLAGEQKGYVPSMMGFGPPGGIGPGHPLAKPLLDALDTDRDGRVSEAEFTAGMKRIFSEWDRDRNGVLDQREIADGLQRLSPPPGLPGPPGPPRP
jgi:spore coat protein H